MNSQNTDDTYAIIMAGGYGERLWPLGRRKCAKQVLPLLCEGRSLIEDTVQRLFPLFSPERILVITNSEYREQIEALLPLPPENIIGEPCRRDTAPCIALATALVGRRSSKATMVVLPSDHVISPAKVFQDSLRSATRQAQSGYLVTLGIKPTYPATGYGYIRVGAAESPGFSRADAFIEKPDKNRAQIFFADEKYRWNSGIFIWRVDAITTAFHRFAPRLGEKIVYWQKGNDYSKDFSQCDKISIDYAVIEKADNLLVGDASFVWNDIGSWNSLFHVLRRNYRQNVVRGRVVAHDTDGCVLFSDKDTLLGTIGIRDMVVVKSGNGILVCPLTETQRIKELIHIISETNGGYL